MQARVVCGKPTEEHPAGVVAELITGDQNDGQYVIQPLDRGWLYLAIDDEVVAYIETRELIRLAHFWEYGRIERGACAERRSGGD